MLLSLDLPLGFGRAATPHSGERQLYRADANRIAVREPGRRSQAAITDERAVLAFKVFDRRLVTRDSYPCMTSRHVRRVEEQLEFGIAAQHVFAVAEAGAPEGPHETEADVRGRIDSRLARGSSVLSLNA